MHYHRGTRLQNGFFNIIFYLRKQKQTNDHMVEEIL